MNIDIFDRLRSFVERAIDSLSTKIIWLDDAKLILETVDDLRAELASKDEQIEKLEDALHKISNWCKAYPLEIADEPTEDEWKTAHAIMNQHGWSLTTFVVSGMRRVTNGISEIADLGG